MADKKKNDDIGASEVKPSIQRAVSRARKAAAKKSAAKEKSERKQMTADRKAAVRKVIADRKAAEKKAAAAVKAAKKKASAVKRAAEKKVSEAKKSLKKNRIDHIREMGESLEKADSLLDSVEALLECYEQSQTMFAELESYAKSKQWSQDIRDDEGGKFPEDMNRSALSIEDVRRVLKKNRELAGRLRIKTGGEN